MEENRTEKKEHKYISMIGQAAVVFLIGILTTGFLTFGTQRVTSDTAVRLEREQLGFNVAQEVILSIKEYPAYEWLISYWHQNYQEMEIEYDADYGSGTETEEKCKLFSQHNPGLILQYVTAEQLDAMSEEDQKLYAEIIYSWQITQFDAMKKVFKTDYLFCVLTDADFKSQFFLFSAADEDDIRGSNYEEVYTLGTVVSVEENESLQNAMRGALENSNHLADAGNYVDYYAYIDTVDNMHVLVGITYSVEALRTQVYDQAEEGTKYALTHQVVLSLILLGMIWVLILWPLQDVQKIIRRYKLDKDSKAAVDRLSKIESRNEIGRLAEDVSELAGEIDSYLARIEKITSERERIGTELALAARIQSNSVPNVFPPFPERKEFDIYASMDPAKEVGGDFYDFFMIDEDHLALLIADVSGKGIPGALFMMVSMIIIKNVAADSTSPATTLGIVNDQICRNNPEEMFVSVWLGILDLNTGELTAANAGHEYPCIKMPGRDFELVRDRHGFVIGGMEGMEYKDYTVKLQPGAKLFVYTDGVPEAAASDGERFGIKRMLKALRKDPEADVVQVLANVRSAVDEFVQDAEQFDDLTMMCLEYKGRNE